MNHTALILHKSIYIIISITISFYYYVLLLYHFTRTARARRRCLFATILRLSRTSRVNSHHRTPSPPFRAPASTRPIDAWLERSCLQTNPFSTILPKMSTLPPNRTRFPPRTFETNRRISQRRFRVFVPVAYRR